MRFRHSARVAVLVTVALGAMVWSGWTLRAQSVAKRPLTYDVYESWKSIAEIVAQRFKIQLFARSEGNAVFVGNHFLETQTVSLDLALRTRR